MRPQHRPPRLAEVRPVLAHLVLVLDRVHLQVVLDRVLQHVPMLVPDLARRPLEMHIGPPIPLKAPRLAAQPLARQKLALRL